MGESRVYVVTEVLEGSTLREYIDTHEPLAGEELRNLAGELRDALAALHDTGALHRNICPSSVILTADGPRLAFFGLAIVARDKRRDRLGFSPRAYTDPRVLAGVEPDAPADDWALAATIAFAALGRDPSPEEAMAYRNIGGASAAPFDSEDLPDELWMRPAPAASYLTTLAAIGVVLLLWKWPVIGIFCFTLAGIPLNLLARVRFAAQKRLFLTGEESDCRWMFRRIPGLIPGAVFSALKTVSGSLLVWVAMFIVLCGLRYEHHNLSLLIGAGFFAVCAWHISPMGSAREGSRMLIAALAPSRASRVVWGILLAAFSVGCAYVCWSTPTHWRPFIPPPELTPILGWY